MQRFVMSHALGYATDGRKAKAMTLTDLAHAQDAAWQQYADACSYPELYPAATVLRLRDAVEAADAAYDAAVIS